MGLIWILVATRLGGVQGGALGCHALSPWIPRVGKMPISQMRKQRLNIWPVCAAAGLEGSSNPAATSCHILSIMGRWCGKLPRSIRKAYQEEVFPKLEVCLNRSCWWERPSQADGSVVQRHGGGKRCVSGTQNSAGLLKREVQGPWEVGDAGEVGVCCTGTKQ